MNVVKLGDEYLALTETPLPVAFDGDTLDTLGVADWAGDIPGLLTTAHPHGDRGELINYAAHLGPVNRYRIYTLAPGGKPRVAAQMRVRKPAYMHSFGLTERFYVLAENPYVVDPLRLAAGRRPFIENFEWEPERGLRFHLFDRDGGELRASFEAPPGFVFHLVNCYDEGEQVVADISVHDDASIIDALYMDRIGNRNIKAPPPRLLRYRLDLEAGECSSEQLTDIPFELPRIDYGRRNGRPYRYAYGVSSNDPADWTNVIAKVDVTDGSFTLWHEPGCYPSEPVFVRNPDGTARTTASPSPWCSTRRAAARSCSCSTRTPGRSSHARRRRSTCRLASTASSSGSDSWHGGCPGFRAMRAKTPGVDSFSQCSGKESVMALDTRSPGVREHPPETVDDEEVGARKRFGYLMRHSKLWLAALILLLVVGVAVVASQALFTSSSANANNEASAGILTQDNSKSDAAILTALNMVPGQNRTGTVTIKNTGSVDGTFRLSDSDLTNYDRSGAVTTTQPLFSDVVRLTVFDNTTNTEVYNGPIDALNTVTVDGTSETAWKPDESHDFTFTVTFVTTGSDAQDNDYQGTKTKVTYNWDATSS